MTIEPPDVEPLLDPTYAESEARRVFGDRLDVVADLRAYGRDLFKRLTVTSVQSLPDLVVVGGLLRQTLVSLDGWHLCASQGAAQAARLHLRSYLEAFLYIEWIITKGVEPWARRLYIANVRNAKRVARRLIPGTEEHRLFNEAWKKSFDADYAVRAEAQAAAEAQDRSALDAQEHPANEPIYREFEAFVAKVGREPEWHELGVDGVPSIFKLATTLDRRAEYYALYEAYSTAVHGTRSDLHFRKDNSGAILFEPVRNPARLLDDVGLAVAMPVRTYQLLLGHYRPGELVDFAKTYAERWRACMQPPNVKVNDRLISLS